MAKKIKCVCGETLLVLKAQPGETITCRHCGAANAIPHGVNAREAVAKNMDVSVTKFKFVPLIKDDEAKPGDALVVPPSKKMPPRSDEAGTSEGQDAPPPKANDEAFDKSETFRLKRMIQCPYCGKHYPRGTTFCEKCDKRFVRRSLRDLNLPSPPEIAAAIVTGLFKDLFSGVKWIVELAIVVVLIGSFVFTVFFILPKWGKKPPSKPTRTATTIDDSLNVKGVDDSKEAVGTSNDLSKVGSGALLDNYEKMVKNRRGAIIEETSVNEGAKPEETSTSAKARNILESSNKSSAKKKTSSSPNKQPRSFLGRFFTWLGGLFG